MVKAGLELEGYFITFIALFVSLLTLYSMTKIWAHVFWKNAPDDAALSHNNKREYPTLILAIVFMAAITAAISLYAEPFLNVAFAGADQLLNPQGYIDAVLGGN